jgi:putative nucleotidyltransferase with HDIG domain
LSPKKFKFRLTFLAKFTLITFALAVVTASALAFTLVRAHRQAVEQDESINAAGEIVATLSPSLEKLAGSLPDDPGVQLALQNGVATGLRHQFVSGIRIYAPNGTAIYPASSVPDPEGVAAALHSEDVSFRTGRTVDGLPVRIEYAPFASHGRIVAVLAIELSLDQMRSQADAEQRIVVLATGGAIAIIFVALVAQAAGASRELERRRRTAENTFSQTLGLLADSLELRDPYTAGHSRRVSEYSRELARALHLKPREIEVIAHAALLHDIGKIGIPDSVLLKPTGFNEHDRAVISRHPILGAQILSNITSMEDVVPCVLHHHERIDGNGYPGKLVAESIPIGARVIAVADTFDAMTTDRPYRRALSVEIALTEMQRITGTQLDLTLVARFIDIVRSGRIVPPPPATDESDLVFGPQAGLRGLPNLRDVKRA